MCRSSTVSWIGSPLRDCEKRDLERKSELVGRVLEVGAQINLQSHQSWHGRGSTREVEWPSTATPVMKQVTPKGSWNTAGKRKEQRMTESLLKRDTSITTVNKNTHRHISCPYVATLGSKERGDAWHSLELEFKHSVRSSWCNPSRSRRGRIPRSFVFFLLTHLGIQIKVAILTELKQIGPLGLTTPLGIILY
jgi:hypothetical protein